MTDEQNPCCNSTPVTMSDTPTDSPKAPETFSVCIVFVNGYVCKINDFTKETYEKIMEHIKDSTVTSFTLNDQYFNKSTISTVFKESQKLTV